METGLLGSRCELNAVAGSNRLTNFTVEAGAYGGPHADVSLFAQTLAISHSRLRCLDELTLMDFSM